MGRFRRHKKPLWIVSFIFVILLAWMSWPQAEPFYGGIPASDYVQSVLSNNLYSGSAINLHNGSVFTNHFKPMGTSIAVSAIAKVMTREDAPWKHWYQKALPYAPTWLRKRLTSPRFDQNLILAGAIALGSFGPDARAAIPTLLDTAIRPGREISGSITRISAVRSLANIDPTGEKSALQLALLIDDPDISVVVTLTDTLRTMAKRTPSLTPGVHAAAKSVLKKGSPSQVWSMMAELPQLMPNASDTVPLLIATLENNDERVRAQAALALGRLGLLATDAIPTLMSLRTDEWSNVREAATNALKAIDTSAQ